MKNDMLSCPASIQAPVIMMSQHRKLLDIQGIQTDYLEDLMNKMIKK